jgi:pyruvate dehydrogenase E2 component (dihydrolipoamide acetyltransferase)
MAEFQMPSLGADMEAGTLTKWLVKPGDVVRRGDLVAVVQTEKADVEVEVFTDGTVEKILVAEGEKVPVGALLATIRREGEAAEAAPAPAPAPPPVERARASPAARRRAEELGIDLASLSGSGPDGSITIADVEAASAPAVEKPVAVPDRAAAMRRAIAAAMSRSNREIPHYYLGTEIDLGAAMRWLGEENARRPVTERILPAALLLRAVALAVREVPEMNGFWLDGSFRPSASAHLGVAISLPSGLVAPALHDAEKKTLGDLMKDLRDLVTRARAGSLRSSEVSDPTITVTNLGDLGVETVYGVIFPPQVALVGFGRIVERPRVRNGAVQPAPTVLATLSGDHRASDGHRGGLFLATIDRLLQKPEAL